MTLKRSKELENVAAKMYLGALDTITPEVENTITDEEYNLHFLIPLE